MKRHFKYILIPILLFGFTALTGCEQSETTSSSSSSAVRDRELGSPTDGVRYTHAIIPSLNKDSYNMIELESYEWLNDGEIIAVSKEGEVYRGSNVTLVGTIEKEAE